MIEQLIMIRRLIEGGWIESGLARDANRHRCSPYRKEAVYFSLFGAIHRVTENKTPLRTEIIKMLWGLIKEKTGKPLTIGEFNEQHTKEQVLDLLNVAILSGTVEKEEVWL